MRNILSKTVRASVLFFTMALSALYLHAQCNYNCGFAYRTSDPATTVAGWSSVLGLGNVPIYIVNRNSVGVCTPYPQYTLDVNGSLGADDLFSKTMTLTGNSTFWGTIYAAQKIGIGTNSPDVRLVVNGNCKAMKFIETSDKRLKENIVPLTEALNKLCFLRPVSYNLITDPEGQEKPETELGLLAQDVEQVFPEVVQTDAEGYKSIAYTRLIPVLIGAVQEQQREIARLQREIQNLKSNLTSPGKGTSIVPPLPN